MAPILFLLMYWLFWCRLVEPYALLSPRAPSLNIRFIHFDATLDTGETVEYAFYGGIVEYEKEITELFPEDTVKFVAGLGLQAFEEAVPLQKMRVAAGRDHKLTGMNTFVVGKEV
jgi:hypothetical protein